MKSSLKPSRVGWMESSLDSLSFPYEDNEFVPFGSNSKTLFSRMKETLLRQSCWWHLHLWHPTRRSIRNILWFFKNYSVSSILVQYHKLTKTGKISFSFLIIKISDEECLFKYKRRFFSEHHVEAITKFAPCWETVICFINRAGQRCWCVDLLFMRHIQIYLDHQSF